jgi:hypothetical protein
MEGATGMVTHLQAPLIVESVRGLSASEIVLRMSVVDWKRSDAVNNSSLHLCIDLPERSVVRLALARVSRSARERSVSAGAEICGYRVAWVVYRVKPSLLYV